LLFILFAATCRAKDTKNTKATYPVWEYNSTKYQPGSLVLPAKSNDTSIGIKTPE